MRALTRMRTLAAACALLLFVSGMAAAGRPGLPIDKTGQPENPSPPMVGDPDDPMGLPLAITTPWGVFWFRLNATALKYLGLPAPRLGAEIGTKRPTRGRHAR